jgi:streptogramin lyase
MKPYKIYDLDNANGSSYTFKFKGKDYNKLFIDGHGAVSFGNNETAEMVIAPMWGDVHYQSELESLENPYEDVENDFMWIANAGNNTLSKINTHTGVKIGDYAVGSSPSRTAVGFDGSVWVGNRNSHDVTKLDRYGNFVCEVDLNWGCGPRGLALDKDENLWTGCWGGGRIYKIVDTKIEPSSSNNYAPRCQILDLRASGDNSSNLAYKGNPYGTYGFAFDKHGILWSSGLWSQQTIRIDTNKVPGSIGFFEHFAMGLNTYGLVVDYDDNIWHARYTGGANSIGVLRSTYNPTTHTLSTQSFPIKDGSYGNGRGVAIDRSGNIWVAYSNLHKVGKYAPDGTALGLFPLNGNLKSNGTVGQNCTSPIGIGVDGDGDVWANCYSTGNSEELDSDTGIQLNNFATGPSPYCYSDNTGFSLRNITASLKKTKFDTRTATYKVYNSSNECIRIERKLVVQWSNVRMKKLDNNGNLMGYTEATFEIIFDNGRSFSSNTPGDKCDVTNLQEDSVNRDVTITYVYGGVKGSDYDLKTGGNTETTLRAIYALDQNNLQYEHVINSHDAGTVNSGSKFVISSSK